MKKDSNPTISSIEIQSEIKGAFGTIRGSKPGSKRKSLRRIKVFLAILGPGIIVMAGDNDAGAFGTYTQAGQNYGTKLLWTLPLLAPVLYISQEMVLRLGLLTKTGHARLIVSRFGKIWGAFSVIDLFILNALTIVTEFIGIHLGLSYLGLPNLEGIALSALFIIGAAFTGSFQRFERICMILVLGSFILIPIYVMNHPAFGVVAHDFVVPSFPKNAQFSTVMILIIGIVGTTVAPWQLFFQQSYVIDKKITIRFMRYEKADLLVGILLVILGATAMMAFSAAAFRGHSTFGSFSDAKGVAEGLGKYSSHLAGIFFAIALVDASIIGASAVGLSTSYAIADVMGFSHSLNHRPKEAKLFYAIFAGVIALSAIIVAIPGSPLGLLTEGVQTLAGILLPSAVVFLLLLCNDKEVVGPWANSRRTNVFTSIIVAFLIMLSTILTASVLFSHISKKQIVGILLVGTLLFAGAGLVATIKMPKSSPTQKMTLSQKMKWRMAPINELQAPVLSPSRKIWLAAMRGYLVVASLMVIVKVIELARGR